MTLVHRRLPKAPGDNPGLLTGFVSRLAPLHVLVDDREYGPVLMTKTVSDRIDADELNVNDPVLIGVSDVDNDRLIVIDRVL